MSTFDGKIPAFSAGPLLMPPIRLETLPKTSRSESSENLQAARRRRVGMHRALLLSIRSLGARTFFAARVRPLTLSSLIRGTETGLPPMSQIEAERWAAMRRQRMGLLLGR
jgi:hypothetical protein